MTTVEISQLSLDDLRELVAATDAQIAELTRKVDQGVVSDSDSGLFAIRELTSIIANAYKQPREALPVPLGQVLPIDTETGGEWDLQVEVPVWDTFGIASVIHEDSNGGNEVGYLVQRALFNIVTLGCKTTYGYVEMNAAQAKGKPLEQYRTAALLDAVDRYVQRYTYTGDIDNGVLGLLSSGLPVYQSPTTFANAASADSLLSLVSTPVQVVETRASTIRPKKLVLPKNQFFQLNNTYRSGTDKTVLQAFKESQAAVGGIESIVMDNSLQGIGRNGTDVMLVLPDDPRAMSLIYPMYSRLLPPQQVNLSYVVHCIARTGLAAVKMPQTGLVVEGI